MNAQIQVRISGMVLSLAIGYVTGTVTSATAGHEGDTPCQESPGSPQTNYRGSGIGEFTGGFWPSGVLGRDGVRARMQVFDPRDQGYKNAVVHSVYLWESDADAVETGWEQAKDAFAAPSIKGVVFAARVWNSEYVLSETHPTPFLDPGTDHLVKIEHNPNGGAPYRYEFTIDSNQWGFYAQSNMPSGGAVVAGTENFNSCEDFRTHAWNLDKQLVESGTWSNWVTPVVVMQNQTKWWKNVGANPPPEWWIYHCSQPWCLDDM